MFLSFSLSAYNVSNVRATMFDCLFIYSLFIYRNCIYTLQVTVLIAQRKYSFHVSNQLIESWDIACVDIVSVVILITTWSVFYIGVKLN